MYCGCRSYDLFVSKVLVEIWLWQDVPGSQNHHHNHFRIGQIKEHDTYRFIIRTATVAIYPKEYALLIRRLSRSTTIYADAAPRIRDDPSTISQYVNITSKAKDQLRR